MTGWRARRLRGASLVERVGGANEADIQDVVLVT